MADIYELFMALDLREGIPDEEVAELRWHLGSGDRPEALRIVAAFPQVVGDDGEAVVDDLPEPLMAGRGGPGRSAERSYRCWNKPRTWRQR